MHVWSKLFMAFWYGWTAAHFRIQTKSIIHSATFALGCGGPGFEFLSPTLLVLPLPFCSSLELTVEFCFVPFSLPFTVTFISLQKFAQAPRVQVVAQIFVALFRRETLSSDQLSRRRLRLGVRSGRRKGCTA